MGKYETYLTSAREFAKNALNSTEPSVVIQNAHKASEFALMAYAIKKKKLIPTDHWGTTDLAFQVSREFGKKFNKLLKYYLGAYRLENGDRAKNAVKLMKDILKVIEDAIGEAILPH